MHLVCHFCITISLFVYLSPTSSMQTTSPELNLYQLLTEKQLRSWMEAQSLRGKGLQCFIRSQRLWLEIANALQHNNYEQVLNITSQLKLYMEQGKLFEQPEYQILSTQQLCLTSEVIKRCIEDPHIPIEKKVELFKAFITRFSFNENIISDLHFCLFRNIIQVIQFTRQFQTDVIELLTVINKFPNLLTHYPEELNCPSPSLSNNTAISENSDQKTTCPIFTPNHPSPLLDTSMLSNT